MHQKAITESNTSKNTKFRKSQPPEGKISIINN